ncbi:MAG: hypothetical protein L6R39_007766, partial [Caloplaca ligustica]
MEVVDQIYAHLAEVTADPAGKGLNVRLLEKFDGQVTENIAEADRDMLIHQLADLLPNLQQDPTPLATLIEILIRPPSYTFSRVLQIRPPVDFTAGLSAPSPPINLVTLYLLEKAKLRRSDVDIVAGKPEVIASLIQLWLSTPETAVSQKAHDVFLALLTAEEEGRRSGTAEHDGHHEPHHQSLMWRRVFRDKDIYELMYRICSLKNAGQDGQLGKRDKTVAQARLLDLLLKIDCESIRTSQIEEVEERYGVKRNGLLEYAAVKMVDYEDDVLMHMTLIDFYAELLKPDHSSVRDFNTSTSSPHSSPSLDFLLHCQLHARTLSYYLEPSTHSSLDLTYLYSRSANYLATYCSSYPERFLSTETASERASVLRRVTEALQNVSPGQWAQDRIPKHDLHVLASLPGYALLPDSTHGTSPLFQLPTKPLNAAALQTLATVFQGPIDLQADPASSSSSKAVARALYFLYLNHNPQMWHEVVKGAETVALKDVALAAISLIEAVITASWAPLPPAHQDDLPLLPTEHELAEQCHSPQPLPPSGILAILASPALETVLPCLLRPAQTFSNLVGGGKGDVDGSAYRVAAAKYDVLLALKARVREV